MEEYVDHREQEGGIGLGLDRDPLRRASSRNGEMRLDLHALHAALARVGVALDTAHATRRLDVGAKGDEIVAQRRIRGDGEGAVPELSIEMLGVVTLDA